MKAGKPAIFSYTQKLTVQLISCVITHDIFMDRWFYILSTCTFLSVMKTPKKGFKGITVSDALYSQLQGIATAEDLSMPDHLRKMLGTLYPDCPAGSGEENKGKEYNYTFEVYQNDKKVGVFKITGAVRDYAWGNPIVTSMEARSFEVIAEEVLV